jgi:hypothetical protein
MKAGKTTPTRPQPPTYRTSTGKSPSEAAPRRKLFSIAGLIALALAAGALLSFHWIYEADFWFHLAQGREIAAGRFVHTNVFSSTNASYPQPFTSWLFELGAFHVWRLGGAVATQVGQALIIALALAACYFACRRRGSVAVILAIEAFGVFVIEPRAVPRPHLMSLLLMALCTLLVEWAREKRSAAPLLWAIPLVALWSNIHAECFFGAAFIGLYAAAEFVRPEALSRRQAWMALAIAAACTMANFANPYGFGLYRYLFENAHASDVVQIAEFRPAYLPVYAPFFAYLVAGAGLMLWKPRKLSLWEIVAFAAFAILALRTVRFVALFFFVSAPMVAARLSAFKSKIINGPILVLAAGLAGLLLAPLPLSVRIDRFGIGPDYLEPRDILSPGAISFIRSAGLKGPIFNSNNLGGYLAWNLYPDVRIFQDGRFQAYPLEHFARIHQAYESQSGWDQLVAGFDWAVLSIPRGGPLSGTGRFRPSDWAAVYQDQAVGVVVRRSGKYGWMAASAPPAPARP